jgi:hypothetical protein
VEKCGAVLKSHLSFRIIAHEYLGEGGIKRLNVLCEVLTIGELELLLAALLDGYHCNISLARSVAEDSGTELFVNQNTDVIPWYNANEGANS